MGDDDMSLTIDRVTELEEIIRYHRDIHYNNAVSEITDAEFDALVDELTELEPGSPVLAEVGAPVAAKDKVKHDHFMGSLNKATWDEDGEMSEMREWMDKSPEKWRGTVRVCMSPKMDGAACRLTYADGMLVQAATRGNGEWGQDVTENVKVIRGVPHSVPGFTGTVPGEVCMKKSVFSRLNDEGFDLANPRNAAAGVLTAKDVAKTKEKDLDFVAYDIISDDRDFELDYLKLNYLAGLGFQTLSFDSADEDEVEAILFDWENVRRENYDYPIDGCVVAYLVVEDQEEVGMSSGRPRGKIAWKFRPEQKVAKLLGIDWQVGRTGRVTPVANIKPTQLAGTTVQYLTLHNWKNVRDMGLCNGDDVLVMKAGDIIPQVVERVTESKAAGEVSWPKDCPCCGSELDLDDNVVSLWCNNSLCQAKLEARVGHYLKRLEILGIGPATIKGMCDRGMISDLADLYYLDIRELRGITGGETAAKNVYTAILEKCEIPLAQFLSALGVHSLGRTTSKLVAEKFKTLANVRTASVVMLTSIEGIGDKSAMDIINGLDAMGSTLDRLLEAVDVMEVEEATGPLVGKSFCLTGAMSRGRKLIAADIEAAGGTVKSSVGRGLDYLVQADPTSESSKSKKARKLGTEVIGEEQLEEMMV
jgi:DNA ligase (NAD+)